MSILSFEKGVESCDFRIIILILIFIITALGNLGSVLSSQGRFEEAEEALLGALKHRSNMAEVHYNL